MATTDTSEKGLEALIVRDLCTRGGYVQGQPADYNRDVAVDVVQLLSFLQATQPRAVETLELANEGINVYEIRPGVIATDMTGGVKE